MSAEESLGQQFTGRQVSFYPDVKGGKYHTPITPMYPFSDCRRVELDLSAGPIMAHVGQERVHPVVCRKCLASAK